MRKVSILGSTGSIGCQTLDVIRKENKHEVVALSAGNNIDLLEEQIREFKPSLVSVRDEKLALELKKRINDPKITVLYGMDGLVSVATYDQCDTVVTAIVGMLGILPTISAIKAKKTICLANKETLVTAGHIIMPLIKEHGVELLPVDSEHSAIFQSIQGAGDNKINRILLTASGGPFRGKSLEELNEVKLEDALKHPNWSMGRKITIDSATMVNKGLEIIEAKWLFDIPIDKITVLVHPQSIIHSAVEFSDGAVIAQLGTPDMRLPIQYALNYPERGLLMGESLDLFEVSNLRFEKPDEDTFYGLKLAREAGIKGGNMPTIFNAANELAVSRFLNREIAFLDIVRIIEDSMNRVSFVENPSVDEIILTEQETYEYIKKGR